MATLLSRVLVTVCTAVMSVAALAQSMSPIGLWQTIDDETKKPKSFIRISEKDGTISGTVEKVVDPAKQDQKCDECAADDPRKGKPVIGMTVLTGLKKESYSIYSGGKILDPNNGKVYTAKVTMIEEGKKLEMRGSFLFIGRTQTWLRVE
jgi:uncharacterized protein (DUF2147 family)